MSLEVINFCVKGKLSVHSALNLTMSGTYFYILIKDNRKVRELAAYVPKRYSYDPSGFSILEYDHAKLREYDVLADFLDEAEDRLCDKWKMDEKSFKELVIGLRIYFIKEFFTGNKMDKFFLLLKEKISLILARL